MSKKALFLVLALTALGLVAACGGGGDAPAPSAEPPAAPVAAAGSGGIAGTISYANGDPDAAIKMGADPVCQGLHTEPVFTEKIVADGGGLANVFVYVKGGIAGSYPAPADKVVLNQQGCQYSPHVSGIMVGQTLVNPVPISAPPPPPSWEKPRSCWPRSATAPRGSTTSLPRSSPM